MGEYLDLFRIELENITERKRVDPARQEIEEKMRKLWLPIPEVEGRDSEAMGIDSSVQSISLSTGYVLLLIRGCAVAQGESRRKVEVHLTTGEIEEVGNRLMENLEHEIGLDGLKDLTFFDGSLYGRASHIPREYRNDGLEDTMLRYYRNYVSLIERAREEGRIIVGISKSAGTTFLRDVVVKKLYDEELERLGIEDEEIRSMPFLVLDRKGEGLRKAKDLLLDRGHERAYSLIEELASKRPDASILSSFPPGMTKPVLLGSSARARRLYKEMKGGGLETLREKFLSLDIDEEDVEVVMRYLDLPSFVSFYVSPLPGMILRVDFPSFLIGERRGMQSVYWPEVLSESKVQEILGYVLANFADHYVHNVHLYAADSDARLTRGDFMDKYYPLIEEYLGEASASDYRYLFRR